MLELARMLFVASLLATIGTLVVEMVVMAVSKK
jgi:hypothetical protein